MLNEEIIEKQNQIIPCYNRNNLKESYKKNKEKNIKIKKQKMV